MGGVAGDKTRHNPTQGGLTESGEGRQAYSHMSNVKKVVYVTRSENPQFLMPSVRRVFSWPMHGHLCLCKCVHAHHWAATCVHAFAACRSGFLQLASRYFAICIMNTHMQEQVVTLKHNMAHGHISVLQLTL